ncbi:MAG: dihydropteroate synthase [Deltaproteobacteria bacterium]|nr:dihydropteroate synthase [Deltaproteobacteria bacterium]
MLSRPLPLIRTAFEPGPYTLVMGVINTTPDSFSDGGAHFEPEHAVAAAIRMLDAGAHIIDVGGESTRPGSLPVDTDEELRRTAPVIREIQGLRPDSVISIDTRRSEVAEAALDAGAQIINDVSGFRDDPEMMELALRSGAGLIVMHMLGTPKTMQQEILYDSFPHDIYHFLRERILKLEQAGIAPDKIVIDPGIGFGKTFDQNLVLINRLDFFRDLRKPLCLGASRKAFLGKILDLPTPTERDLGTVAAVTAGILRGADIVRVHDVASAVQACKVADAILRERVSL